MRTLKVGIIGLGSWGMSHLEAYRQLPFVEVAAVCDANPERLQAAKEQYNIANVYDDAGAMLSQEADIELVSIVTFERNHLQPTLLALQAGKHVIVEKPITTDPDEARQMLAASQQYGRYAVPGHLLRFEPKYAEIKQIIESGQIGKPASIYLKRSRENGLFATYQRTHTVYELMIHDLDQAIWYAGSRVKKVYATGNSVTGAKTPEILWAQLQFESGTVAVLHSNWMTPDAAGIAINDYTEVIGEKGTVHFDTGLAGVQVWTGSGRATTDVSIHHRQNGRVIGCLAEQLNYVGQCIMYGRNPDWISFEDALHGIEVADAIVRSASEGKEIIL